ncbi:MAG: ABC transporter permease [Clostridia bacterium]|nr:ABC transporter permease [Clostridia bacterium]
MIFQTLLTGIDQGLVWAIMAIGVYISYRILDFADLTVEGSFATGGATAAITMTLCEGFVSKGSGQGVFIAIIAMLIAMIIGGFAGLVTGLLNTKLKIAPILSGILTMTALYSVNMFIMGLKLGFNNALASLAINDTLFTKIGEFMHIGRNWIIFIVGFIAVAIVVGLLYWFFGTETGSAMRATGNNEKMAMAQGINTQSSKILGLVLSNALVALSGALVAFQQSNATNIMGVGSIVAGLAAIIIGESIISGKFPFWARLLSVALGSIIYRIIISLIYLTGINTDYVKLLTSALVIVFLAIPLIKEKVGKMPRKNKKVNKSDNGGSSDGLQNGIVDTSGEENAGVSDQISQDNAIDTSSDGDKAVGEA